METSWKANFSLDISIVYHTYIFSNRFTADQIICIYLCIILSTIFTCLVHSFFLCIIYCYFILFPLIVRLNLMLIKRQEYSRYLSQLEREKNNVGLRSIRHLDILFDLFDIIEAKKILWICLEKNNILGIENIRRNIWQKRCSTSTRRSIGNVSTFSMLQFAAHANTYANPVLFLDTSPLVPRTCCVAPQNYQFIRYLYAERETADLTPSSWIVH